MPDSTLANLTAATAATGGLFYGTQSGADRKFTSTAAGATLIEAADAAAQRTALAVLPLTGGTLTGALINSTNGAASTPVVRLTGTTFTGGTATTTKPTLLVEPTGTTSTGWSTAGTLIGANAATGFTGSLLDLQLAGVSKFSVSSSGTITCFEGSGTADLGLVFKGATFTNGLYGNSSTLRVVCNGQVSAYFAANQIGVNSDSGQIFLGTAADTLLTRPAARTFQLGVNASTGLNQTIKACNGTAGAGANLILTGGTGTTTAGGVAIGTNGTASVLIRHGTATLVTGTVTVSDTNIVAGSRIFVNRQTDGGTIGDSYSITRSAGTSFTITSKTANATAALDTSTVSYLIINP
jgi:hypothetical protein